MGVCGGCVNTTYELDCSGECRYTTPSGASANLSDFSARGGEGIAFQVYPSPGFHYPSDQIDQLYIANFEAIGARANIYSNGFNNNEAIVAAECALWMCVQSLNSGTIDAKQTTDVRREFAKVISSNWTGDYVSNFTFESLPGDMNPASSANFTVYVPAVIAMQGFFSHFFNGTVELNQQYVPPFFFCSSTFHHPLGLYSPPCHVLNIRSTNISYLRTRLHQANTDVVQALWNSSASLDPWIRTIASSLTTAIRTLEPQTLPLYNGHGYQLGYDVHWPWITLPALLVAASLLLLLVVMVKTGSSGVSPWKGNPLSALFMSVDEGLRGRGRGALDMRGGVVEAVGKERVGVERDWDGGWKVKSA